MCKLEVHSVCNKVRVCVYLEELVGRIIQISGYVVVNNFLLWEPWSKKLPLLGTSLVVQWLNFCLPMQGVWV